MYVYKKTYETSREKLLHSLGENYVVEEPGINIVYVIDHGEAITIINR